MRQLCRGLARVLAWVALALGLIWAPVVHGRTFDVPCDAAALDDAVEVAGFNDQEDVLWLAPACVYPLAGILVAYADAGSPLTIEGRGATISGQDQRTALLVNPGASVTLRGLTLTEGKAGPTASGDGGAIYNAGELTLEKSIVSDSVARFGGGIFNAEGARLTLVASTVSGNAAGEDGGGILNRAGRVSLFGSTVSGNTAAGQNGMGAGLYNDRSASAPATATLTNSTFSDNASRFGAGVFNDESAMVVSHCTFSDNTMLGGGNGGGIYQRNYTGAGSLKLSNAVVADSIAEFGGGFDCVRDPFVPQNAIAPTGGNLIEDGSCDVPNALSGDPLLGGMTGQPGHRPLLAGSPAIDTAEMLYCAGVDQRGALRPEDGDGDGFRFCDLGAYEAP